HLRVNRDAPRLEILIEPADTVRYAASGAKRGGILKLPQMALHIELPKAARTEWRETYTAVLADFLVQAFPLPPGEETPCGASSPPRRCGGSTGMRLPRRGFPGPPRWGTPGAARPDRSSV